MPASRSHDRPKCPIPRARPVRRSRLGLTVAVATLMVPVSAAEARPSDPVRPTPARADLAVVKVSADASGPLRPGEKVKILATTRNAGRAKARASAIGFWLSTDATKSARDVRLGQRAVKGLRTRAKAMGSTTVTVPRSAPAGAYLVIACADHRSKVREASETNNCRASVQRVVVLGGGAAPIALPAPDTPAPAAAPPAPADPGPAPGPTPPPPAPGDAADLTVADVSDPPAAAREGDAFSVRDTVANADASGRADASAVRYYLSRDSAASLDERRESTSDPRTALTDVLMGGVREIGSLGSGAQSEAPADGTQVRVPIGIAPGTYHLLACADDRGAVAESAEDANCAVATHPVDDREVPTPITILAEEQEYRIDALSDVFTVPALADDVSMLDGLKDAFCANVTPSTGIALPDAIASTKRFLDEQAPGAAAQFAASPEYHDATRLEAAAGAAITAGVPGAALASLVRAHELEPAEASHLINAAAVASSVGLPNEALAMLDAGQRLDDPDRPAFGIGRHAVALANRGQALALLGRRAEANRALDAAVSADPLVTEAHTSRSATTVCTEGADPAAKFLRDGRKRQPPRTPPVDRSRGRESQLRDLPLPGFPEQAAGMKDFYRSQADSFIGEIDEQNARRRQIETRLQAKQENWTRAEMNRYYGMFKLIYGSGDEPDLEAKWDEVLDQLDVVIDIHHEFWIKDQGDNSKFGIMHREALQNCEGSTDPWAVCFDEFLSDKCRPALRLDHQAWVDEMQELYDLGAAYHRALSKRMSGYATNLSDADARAEALLQIEALELGLYSLIQQQAQFWTHYANLNRTWCVEGVEPPTATTPEAADPDAEEGCSPALKAMRGVFELGPTKLKISCDFIQQSIKWEEVPWLQAYAEVKYDFRMGKLSVFGGTKAEVPAGVAKGAFKSGIYVTVDRAGTTDVGWRVGPSATVGTGPVEFEVYKDEIDLSFVGAVSSTFGL